MTALRYRLIPDDGHIDEVAVSLAVAGDTTVRLTHAEARAAIAQLNQAGFSDGAIAEHVGCNVRTVQRVRAELRLPGVAQKAQKVTRRLRRAA